MNMQTHEILLNQADPVAIISASLDGKITVFNQNAEHLLGYQACEVIGEETPLLFHEQHELQQLQEHLSSELHKPISGFETYTALLNTKRMDHSWTYVNKDGTSIPVQTQVSAINNEAQETIGLLFLITKQRHLDVLPLKDLPNEDVFLKVLTREFKRMQRESLPISVLKIDVDNYKNYLAAEGEEATLLCLEQIGVVLQQRIQRAGDLLSYHNHDEFAVVLPNTDQPGAVKVAEVLRLLVAGQQMLHPQSSTSEYVTVSIGLTTMLPQPSDTVDELLQKVDRGLRQAKLENRNCTRIGE